MRNLIEETVEKIKKQRIAPEPKWKYALRKYGLWALFGIIAFLTAVSFSAAYHDIFQLDWDLYRFLHQNAIIYFLSLVPYFWVILAAVLGAAAFWEIRRTETGYRFSRPKIIIVILGAMFVFGFFASTLGFGGKISKELSKVTFYRKHLAITKESQWSQPEKGFLAGTIRSVSNGNFNLIDFNGKDWNVIVSDQTFVRPAADIKEKEMVKIIGREQNGNTFEASEIRPWAGKGIGKGNINSSGNQHQGITGGNGGQKRGK